MIEHIEPTWLSLIPPTVAILLAFVTKRVISSLLAGILAGGVVLAHQTGSLADLNVITRFFIPALYTKTYAIIVMVYLVCLGIIIGTWEKTGSAEHFAASLGRRIAKGPRSAMFFGWVLGLIFHQGGSISTIMAGTTLKPITDKHRVSHEELCYVVDSTASPIATLIPFNAWPLYVSGIIAGTVPFLPDNLSSYQFYLKSLFFNFYALFAITSTLLLSLGIMPWVGKRMHEAILRARTTGQLDHFNASPLLVTEDGITHKDPHYQPSLWDFLLPLSAILGITVSAFVLWKMNLVSDKYSNMINEAFIIASLLVVIIALWRGLAPKSLLTGVKQGLRSMLLGVFIIGLAITIGSVTQKLGAAQFLINLSTGHLSPLILPALLTLLCMIVAFATGTSLGTYAVIYPVAMPLAFSLNPDMLYMQVCFGAVLGGTVFGDQCSPISDTTILSSMFTGCDLMHHVKTQMPLALLAAFLSMVVSTAILFVNYPL